MSGPGTTDGETDARTRRIDELLRRKQYQEALPLAKEAFERARELRGEDAPELAPAMGRLADVYGGLGRFEEAEPLYRRSIDLLSRKPDDNAVEISTDLNGLAAVLIGKDDYAAAEPLLRRALAIDLQTVGEGSDHHLETLTNLGMLKYHQAEYAEAERLLLRALEGQRRPGKETDPGVADSLNRLAGLYQAINDRATAEDLLKEALRIRREGAGPLDVAQSLNNLALLYRREGRCTEARPLYEEGLQICRRVGSPPATLARMLSNLAGALVCLGDLKGAEPLVHEALAIRRGAGEPTWALGITLNNLATLHHAAGEYETASSLYGEAIAIGRRFLSEGHPKLRTALANLAVTYVAMQRHADALAAMREVMAIDDRLIANVFPVASESERIAYLATLQQGLDAMLSLISGHFADSPAIVCEGLDLVLRRKGIVVESLVARRDEPLAGGHPSLEPTLRELRRVRVALARGTVAGPDPAGTATRADQLSHLEQEARRLEADLARESPELSLEQRLRSADRRQVAQALPEGAILIELVRFSGAACPSPAAGTSPTAGTSTRYAAFVMRAGAPDGVRLVDLGEAEPIDDLVARFRESVAHPPTWLAGLADRLRRRSADDAGERLRARVFDPLGLRPVDASHLFLATEGAVAWVPFEALPTGDGDHLVARFEISYLGVGRDLLRLASPSPVSSGAPVVVADPNFDLVGDLAASPPGAAEPRRHDPRLADLYFPRLPKSRREGEQVAGLLGVQPVLGDAALEGPLRRLRSPRILHLATHGFFLPDTIGRDDEAARPGETGWLSESDDRPGVGTDNLLLRSGLAFAGVNTWLAGGLVPAGAGDGILDAVDVSALDLAGTELAVLSACDTGLGAVHVWEGVFGLRRSLTVAGARTLVMSLWKVPDDQTVELMLLFYRQLLAGTPRAAALRAAQLALKKRYPSPFYWGAFICQGDPGPMHLDLDHRMRPCPDAVEPLPPAGRTSSAAALSAARSTGHPPHW